MHRITMPDGSTRPSAFLRAARTGAYLMIAAGGALLIVSDLLVGFYGPLAEVMAWFLLVGGALSAVGSGLTYWWGEFIGLPLLAPSFITLGVLVWKAGHESAPYIAAANLFLLASFGVLLTVRWRIVLALYKVVMHVAVHGRRYGE
jgi:hypothetical protein